MLARAGKTVLRPGGRELSERLLAAANPRGRRVVELAPGMGVTARRILALEPLDYTAVEQDADAVRVVRTIVDGAGEVVQGDAAATGLATASSDLVVGEAMLTMQGDRGKRAIVQEAHRVLGPGGRYAIHELALRPDDLDDETQDAVRRDLARAINVNARPLTVADWRALLESEGFVVDWWDTNPMALLQPGRIVADEGVGGLLQMALSMLREQGLRRRILTMRATFRQHRDHLCAVAIVAHRAPDEAAAAGQP